MVPRLINLFLLPSSYLVYVPFCCSRLDWAGCSLALNIGLVDVFGFMMARLIKITWSFFKFEKKTLEQVAVDHNHTFRAELF